MKCFDCKNRYPKSKVCMLCYHGGYYEKEEQEEEEPKEIPEEWKDAVLEKFMRVE